MIVIYSCTVLLVIYIALLLLYRYGWAQQKSFQIQENFTPSTSISVIVAARNETDNIERCVRSILAQNYPSHLFELIVIDDFSTDNTALIVENITAPNLSLIRLSEELNSNDVVVSFKKKALSTGISRSKGQLIVTTDADCWMDKNWLHTLAAFYEENEAQMIVAPVRFSNNFSALQLFQSLDFTTMQGITAATVNLDLGIMCNGANLAFERSAYNAVGGYEGVDHLVSGDDYLLQLKIKERFPDGVQYLKSSEVIVDTLPQKSWGGFLQQRIRWASKTGKYDDRKMTFILLLVYLFNCSLLASSITVFYLPQYLVPLLYIFLTKCIGELLFLYPVARFFGSPKQLLFFPLFQPFHVLYIVLAGFLSRIGNFKWKQRPSHQRHTKKYSSNA